MVDVPALLHQLIEDVDELSAYELGVLSRSIPCATEAPAMPPDGMDVVAAALGADSGGRDIQAEAAKVYLVEKVAIVIGPGRGYSEWVRAPNRAFTPVDRVAEYRPHPERFREKFTLLPDEFDVLYARVQRALQNLPRRKLSLPNRLAQALRYMRSHMPQADLGAWMGCGHSCSNDDIDDVVAVIYNDPATAAEISWPSQPRGDEIVRDVAAWRPNLAGSVVTGDAKKRTTNQRGKFTSNPPLSYCL